MYQDNPQTTPWYAHRIPELTRILVDCGMSEDAAKEKAWKLAEDFINELEGIESNDRCS